MFIDAAWPFRLLSSGLEKKAFQFAFAKIINVLILVGLNLYFFLFAYWLAVQHITFDFHLISAYVRQTGYGIEYVFIANLIANAFYLYFFTEYYYSGGQNLIAKCCPSMLIYAYPIMLTGLAGMTNEMFSRWTLEWWLPKNFYPGKSSMYALGVFAAAINMRYL